MPETVDGETVTHAALSDQAKFALSLALQTQASSGGAVTADLVVADADKYLDFLTNATEG